MRICLVGDFAEPEDMGERRTARRLRDLLSRRHSVVALAPKSILSAPKLVGLRRFGPEVVHYLLGPRSRSFLILWLLKQIAGRPITVASALRPVIPRAHLPVLRLFKPDLVLAQSSAHARVFARHGFDVRFVPNGVDLDRFRPVDGEARAQLRAKYGIPRDPFVVLHVGYVARRRGIELLARIAEESGVHVVVAAATSWIAPEAGLLDRLTSAGCRVITEYLPSIEELYQLSDCFVFPGAGQPEVKDGFESVNQSPSIEIPLSVLEAMSCNLPVVSTSFGGLADLFPNARGIRFVQGDAGFLQGLRSLMESPGEVVSRAEVSEYGWEGVVDQVEAAYTSLRHAA